VSKKYESKYDYTNQFMQITSMIPCI